MKFIYFLGLSAISTIETHYIQSPVIDYERVEIIYLPDNICYIKSNKLDIVNNYRDYVRACMNNKHLRLRISNNLR